MKRTPDLNTPELQADYDWMMDAIDAVCAEQLAEVESVKEALAVAPEPNLSDCEPVSEPPVPPEVEKLVAEIGRSF